MYPLGEYIRCAIQQRVTTEQYKAEDQEKLRENIFLPDLCIVIAATSIFLLTYQNSPFELL